MHSICGQHLVTYISRNTSNAVLSKYCTLINGKQLHKNDLGMCKKKTCLHNGKQIATFQATNVAIHGLVPNQYIGTSPTASSVTCFLVAL